MEVIPANQNAVEKVHAANIANIIAFPFENGSLSSNGNSFP